MGKNLYIIFNTPDIQFKIETESFGFMLSGFCCCFEINLLNAGKHQDENRLLRREQWKNSLLVERSSFVEERKRRLIYALLKTDLL